MKNIGFLILPAFLALIIACDEAKNNYTINGTVPYEIENGEVVLMTDYHDGLIIDSAVVSKGKFVFKGFVDQAKAVSLSISYHLQADLILDKGKLTIDMSDPYQAKGNLLTEKLNKFFFECSEAILQTRNQIAEMDESLTDEEKGLKQETIFETLFAQLDEITKTFLKEHPDDVLGAMIFYIWLQNQFDLTTERFNELSRHVGDNVLNFGPVKQMSAHLERIGKTAVGMPFVDFTVEHGNRDGSSVSLSDYVGKGKYVLVDFWASWCMPCRMEAPVLAEVYKKYKGARFEILGVAVMDKRLETIKVIDEDGYTWPQILDAQAVPLELYGIQGIPHIILFGPDGTILARELRGEDLKTKLADVLSTN